jgi:signal transduction histidine kinase
VPVWLKNLLLGEIPARHRRIWIAVLCVLLVLVPIADYALGRSVFHFNLYPLPIALSIFLFGHRGLFSVLILMVSYHLVQVGLKLEAHAVLLNNLAQLGLTGIVGLICSWLMESYRDLYEEKAKLASTRHEILLNLSHELKNPLFAIRGIVKNLARNLKKLPEEEIIQHLNEAQAAIASINRDVEGLTQVFRVDLRGLEPQLKRTKVRELFEAVLKRHPADFSPLHSIIIAQDCHILEKHLLVDPLLIQQSLDNLVSNAIRHTDSGRITLTGEMDGEEFRLSVDDEGAGVPLKDRSRIFERHDQGSRHKPTGFGVGLYLARLYTEAHGGRIAVEEGPVGARFSIYLPERVHD